MAAAISIDNAASGFLRHRFVRAISASWLVLTVLALLGAIAWALYDEAVEKVDEAGLLIIVGPIVLVMFMGGLALITGGSAAIADIIHRRLVALLALSVLAPSIFVFILGGFGGVGQAIGWIPQTTEGDPTPPLPIWQIWMLVAVLIVSLLMALEALGWAWWQMTTSRAGFFAARGWRPAPWRISSAMRRLVGLPAYISNFGRGRVSLTFIYFLAAILNLGLVAILLVPLMLFGIEEGQPDAIQYFGIAMGFAALVVLNFLGVGALLDRIADAHATKLYQDVREWDSRAPIVFLRAFNQDDEKLKAHTRDPVVRFPAGVGSPRTLDEILLEHGSCYGPVIAIGDPRDPTPELGAARVFVQGAGNEWQGVVRDLVGACKAVVMCPNDSEGVKWELDLISDAQGRVRVIFLANPELTPETNTALFARIAPAGETAPALKRGHAPIAAYIDPKKGWTVLTTAKKPSVQNYTVALNWALQAQLGLDGEPIRGQRRKKK